MLLLITGTLTNAFSSMSDDTSMHSNLCAVYFSACSQEVPEEKGKFVDLLRHIGELLISTDNTLRTHNTCLCSIDSVD